MHILVYLPNSPEMLGFWMRLKIDSKLNIKIIALFMGKEQAQIFHGNSEINSELEPSVRILAQQPKELIRFGNKGK